jgi:hypothetical protein
MEPKMRRVTTEELVRAFLTEEFERLPVLTFLHLDQVESTTEFARGIRQYANTLHQRLMRYVTSQQSVTILDIEKE